MRGTRPAPPVALAALLPAAALPLPAQPAPLPTVATTAKVTTSGRKNPRAINDGKEPRSSADHDPFLDGWPAKGGTQWVEYAFEKPAEVSETAVYWFDDTGRGECRVPASWCVLYQAGGAWKPVGNAGPYGVEKERYNRVTLTPVTTAGLRLEVTQQPSWSSGIQEWKVK